MAKIITARLDNLPVGIRYITEADGIFHDYFDCFEPALQKFGISYYIEISKNQEWHVLIKTGMEYYETEVVMAICQFQVTQNAFFIDKIVRNDSIEGSEREGAKLLDVIEFQAEARGKNRIDLRALDREKLIEWYEYRGYVKTGEPRFNEEVKGYVIPMRMKLPRLEL